MPAPDFASRTHAPTIRRRLCAMLYEVLLLAAVEMLAVLVYLLITGNDQAPAYQMGLRAWLFVVTGAYFCWNWVDSGHTLAMKTWRLRVVEPGQPRLRWRTAIVRYVLAWGWFAPAMIVCAVTGLTAPGPYAAVLAAGVLLWAATALVDGERRFLHDRLAGTRIDLLPKPVRAARTQAAR